ncbi:MAG: hypothetical protein ACTSR8_17500 [Promethearchaeota archaeon]
MVDTHSQSFFGQNTGLIVMSSSKSEPFIFMKCIKRKKDGSWEKPSSGEGKLIKFSLEEIVMILQVLNQDLFNWTTYHTYKDEKTPISFSWEDKNSKSLWINIANYSKMLNFAQVQILKLLLTHILKEKIKHSTIINIKNNHKKTNRISQNIEVSYKEITNEDFLEEIEDSQPPKKIKTLKSTQNKPMKERSNVDGAIIGETQKALLIEFNPGNEIWIPKSTIHSNYVPQKNFSQKFLIDTWILKKNEIYSY